MNSSTIRLNDEEMEVLAFALANSPTGSGEARVKLRLVGKLQQLKEQMRRPLPKGKKK